MHFKLIGLVIVTILFSACTSKEEKIQQAIDEEVVRTEGQLDKLKRTLEDKTLRDGLSNIRFLERYGEVVKTNKPEYTDLVDQVVLDASTKGPIFRSLEQRLYDVKHKANEFTSWQERLEETQLIREAASTAIFNDALSDSVNVIADMDPNLDRVKAEPKASELSSNGAKDYGSGSQYIGNPNYGQWQTGSNGMSFWAWYGMYSLFSDLTGGRRVYYNDWSRYRGYSYYHDRGRSRYTSPKSYRSQNNLATKTRKSFASQGKRFTSPYAKQKKGARSLSRASKTPPSSSYSRSSYSRSGGSKSSYSRSSSSRSSFSGSTRRGSSRTSRGLSRGK